MPTARISTACRRLLSSEGIFAGGSTGAVVATIVRKLPALPRPSRIIAIFPDRGDRYLDHIYDDDWLASVQQPHRNLTAPNFSNVCVR
jgi:N-(2-amino-2-carboxyethyl)-L-glutamate synthase